jgi:hypothetical protein
MFTIQGTSFRHLSIPLGCTRNKFSPTLKSYSWSLSHPLTDELYTQFQLPQGGRGRGFEEDCQELITACNHYIFLEVNPVYSYLAVGCPTNAAYLENASRGAKVTQGISNIKPFPT